MRNSKQVLKRKIGDSVLTCCKVNESLVRFLHIFNRVSNKHVSFQTALIRHKAQLYKPWITSGLKKSMKMRDKFYKKWLTTPKTDFLNWYQIVTRSLWTGITVIVKQAWNGRNRQKPQRTYKMCVSSIDLTRKMFIFRDIYRCYSWFLS